MVRDRTPATSTQGKSSIEVMNQMGYDAAALGEGDLAQLGVDLIRQRMAEAQFPVLSANVYVAATGELLAAPYRVTQVGPYRVALIGLTGVAEVAGVEIVDPLEAVQPVVASLADHADIVVLISHAGLDVNEEIARTVAGIDVIVSGGGQRMTMVLASFGEGTAIVHADVAMPGHAGRRLGVGTFRFDAEAQLRGSQWESRALTPDVADDLALLRWVEQNP
ncbi:MAG: hypothetical protein JXA09_00615 [Anaerolineae bacterium]|nr:hypothetical protein [Anaerolineae bacterium]